jgi:hypothetical protein
MATPSNKFRASFTILDQWNSGNWEQAIKTYFKIDKFVTPEMVAGREWHEKWAKHINDTKTLPVEFGGKPLTKPEAEQKTVVQLEDWLELVGIIDCYDSPVVYEWKTGKSTSVSYAGSKQGGIYAMLAALSKRYAERIEIHHFDQYRKTSDMSIIWVTPELLDETHNWIETISSEMHSYFIKEGLYERFGANAYVDDKNNGTD